MAEYVDKQNIINFLNNLRSKNEKSYEQSDQRIIDAIIEAIRRFKTVELKPKTKCGHWIQITENGAYGKKHLYCSVCNEESTISSPYCPNCGERLNQSWVYKNG